MRFDLAHAVFCLIHPLIIYHTPESILCVFDLAYVLPLAGLGVFFEMSFLFCHEVLHPLY